MKKKKILLITVPLICIIGIIIGVVHYKGKQVDSKKESNNSTELADNEKSDGGTSNEEVKDNSSASEKSDVDQSDNKEASATTAKKTDTTKNSKSVAKNEKWIYEKKGYYLYKTNSDKSNKTKVKTEPIWDYNIDGNTLYYISASEGSNGIELKSLYKVNLGTGESKKLSDADTARLCVVGDDIYFDKNCEVFTIKTNGTGLTKISKEKGSILQKADKEFVVYTYNDKGKTMQATVPTKYNKHQIGAVEEVK
ncbi:protein of unknown function [Clostridium cavendishii DSM 21758]|uniref:Prolow-density lipoprotein receptor-related protein 1-like beta-propeller domain-containing protein n=1 Tax=Clostridium cavendishii DSM 21758 TaxID=1121302 RepID=A0A1M6LZT7_9CLOT|nr:DUF5050 domain-containing protein [Clostridium cavendishii]SHJ76757.1 protein of unknown function [Clostridium cavendishii DSM 21758]